MRLDWFTELFENTVARAQQGTLHHALLLSGPAGIGKLELATAMAQSLLCQSPTNHGACQQCAACGLFKAGTHADFYLLESEKQIGVDAVRSVINALSQTAQHSVGKVCIIRAAHTMTESASNALLKTLEEPTSNTYIILLVDEIHRVLPTILSRCEKWSLQQPATELALRWLEAHHADSGPFDKALLQAYSGAPFRVLEALEQNDEMVFERFNADLNSVIAGTKAASKMASEWQEAALRLVNWCQLNCLERYKQTSSKIVLEAYQHCIQASQRLLNPGVNKILILADVIQRVATANKQQQLEVK